MKFRDGGRDKHEKIFRVKKHRKQQLEKVRGENLDKFKLKIYFDAT